MAIFLWDEFRVQVTNSSLTRALASVGWSKKVARQRPKKQNAGLRDLPTVQNLSGFQSYSIPSFIWMSLGAITGLGLGLDGLAGLCYRFSGN